MEKATNKNCPVSTALSLIGGKYKALILWHLTDKTLRFGQIHKLIPEATPKMLTQQLRELERDNLLVRVVHPVVPPKVEYSLSHTGRTLFPILEAMYAWGASIMEDMGLEPGCSMDSSSSNHNVYPKDFRDEHNPITVNSKITDII